MNTNFADHTTKVSFIRGLMKAEPPAWDRFYDFYAPMVVNFARKKGCFDEMADDVLQETVMALLKNMPEFKTEKGRFRSYLFRVALSKIGNAFRKIKHSVNVDSYEFQHDLASDELRHDWDRAWEEQILSDAMMCVQDRVQLLTYRCFEQVYMKKRAVAVVAAELEIAPNLVSQHKHKVFNLILEEAEKLRRQYGE